MKIHIRKKMYGKCKVTVETEAQLVTMVWDPDGWRESIDAIMLLITGGVMGIPAVIHETLHKATIRNLDDLDGKYGVVAIEIEDNNWEFVRIEIITPWAVNLVCTTATDEWGGAVGKTYGLTMTYAPETLHMTSDYKWKVTQDNNYYMNNEKVDKATYNLRRRDARLAQQWLNHADGLMGDANYAETKESKLQRLNAARGAYDRSIKYNNLQATRNRKEEAGWQRDALQSEIAQAKTAFEEAEELVRQAEDNAARKAEKLKKLEAAIEAYNLSIGFNDLQATRDAKTTAERQRAALQSDLDQAVTALIRAEELMCQADDAETKDEKLEILIAAADAYHQYIRLNNLPEAHFRKSVAEDMIDTLQSEIKHAKIAFDAAEELMRQANYTTQTESQKLVYIKAAIAEYHRSIEFNDLQAARDGKKRSEWQRDELESEMNKATMATIAFDEADELMLQVSEAATKTKKLKKLNAAIEKYKQSISCNNLQATRERKRAAESLRNTVQSEIAQAKTAFDRAEQFMGQADNAATNAEKLQKLTAAIKAYDQSIELNNLPATQIRKQEVVRQRNNAFYLAETEKYIKKGDMHIKRGDNHLDNARNSAANKEYDSALKSLKKALENYSSDGIKELLKTLNDRYDKLENVDKKGEVENILKDKFNHIVSSTSNSFFANDGRQRTQVNIDQKTLEK